MNGGYVTNLLLFVQSLSECLDEFKDLADNCPQPDSIENAFLCKHVASVIDFLHSEIALSVKKFDMDDNDD